MDIFTGGRGAKVGLYNADVKSWNADTTFAMAQTLSRPTGLASIPKEFLMQKHGIASRTAAYWIAKARETDRIFPGRKTGRKQGYALTKQETENDA